MEKKSLKSMICKVAKSVAVNSVGRSVPITIHEPKVPEVLKKAQIEKK